MTKPRVCLNMIVKDEAHVIERCLSSAVDIIDCWVIVDTGSTDGTQRIIQKYFDGKGIPGVLYERPWISFGHNRTEALKAAEQYRRTIGTEVKMFGGVVETTPVQGSRFDYLLFLDADETLHVPSDFAWPDQLGDACQFHVRFNETCEFVRNAFVRADSGFYWAGVLHEYLTRDTPTTWQTLPLLLKSSLDGGRSQDPKTYLKDVEILRRALETEPNNTRNVFYLAQSFREAGLLQEALDTYHRRVALEEWDEEVWYAKLQIAMLNERLNADAAIVHLAYLEAYAYRPARAEPLVELARYLRLKGQHTLGALYAQRATEIPYPADILFIDAAIYAWRALDELSVSGFNAGPTFRHAAMCASERLIQEGRYPEVEHDRILQNHALIVRTIDTADFRPR